MSERGIIWMATTVLVSGFALAAGTAAGCSSEDTVGGGLPGTGASAAAGGSGAHHTGGSGNQGGGIQFGGQGGGTAGSGTGADDPCGTGNPSCTESCVGPDCDPPVEFPLPSDDPAPGNVEADGVTRDDDGYIVLDSSQSQSDFLWIADDMNYSVGFISKVRTTPFPDPPIYREVARYVSVTCFSDPVRGSKEGVVLGQPAPAALCADGMHGCCSRDEVTPGPEGGHSPVQVIANRPSRTTVDINGDMWVANRAHWWSGYNQTSVTKIANNVDDCIDRNGNNQIDTSSDADNDGIITTDCNGDNVPDDIDTVCSAGQDKEFYGLDDECILFTTNLEWNGVGRPLALGPGDGGEPTDPSDAWAGMWANGTFYRVDGKTGAIKMSVPRPGTNPYGAAIDQFGILWAAQGGGTALYYFDTNDPNNVGTVTYPTGQHYGIAIDGFTQFNPNSNQDELVQQIWLGQTNNPAPHEAACRYRPVRDQGFAGLATGDWACAVFDSGPATAPGAIVRQGRGIGVDNRTPTSFAWVALDGYSSSTPGAIGRIPIDIAPSQTTTLSGTANTFSAVTEWGMTGAGVASDSDIWGVNQQSSSVVHFGVDADGNVVSGPDVVPLDDKPGSPETFCGHPNCKPHPYTYSDFTGFGLRNFTNPQGFYAWVESGLCPAGQTRFLYVTWDAETPPGTAITMIARSADDLADLDNAEWTDPYTSSPADLAVAPGPLDPNPTSHVEVLFELTTDNLESPKLKSFNIVYECLQVVPTAR